jgi:hypothetical protein
MRTILQLSVLMVLTQVAMAQYTPVDKALYDTIAKMDSLFFAAYNTCDKNLDTYASYYADTLEFLHDHGGYSNSKKDVVESTRKNVCGRVTRKLVAGSMEVYPIANYGAVEIGYHTFQNIQDPPDTPHHPGRFVIVWRRNGTRWQITRVISLH